MSREEHFYENHAQHENYYKKTPKRNIERNIVNNIEKKAKNSSRNRKKRKSTAVRKFFLILFIFFVGMAVTFGRYIYKSGGSITGAVMNMAKDVVGDQDPIFVVIMGISDDISIELTDTIMLVGYNPDSNRAFILSIPRDTFVGKSRAYASGYDKINALYQKSPQKTVEAVEQLTGVNVDYYITVKTSALVKIVDSIGGVEFNVPINMNYDDPSQNLHIHLKAGKQILNGKQAEHLVRFRHNNNGTTYSRDYGDNDEGRMRTQREFLKQTAHQVISWNNIDKIQEIASIVFKNLSTNIDLSKVLAYAPYVVQFDTENNLVMEQLPGESKMINGLWFYEVDSSKTQKIISSYIEKLELNSQELEKYFNK